MKLKSFCKKRSALAVFLLLAVITALVFTVFAAAEQSGSDSESRPEIDVWLIAGQSNAVGFGSDGLSLSYLEDKRYTEGFENVLFWGKYESTYNPEDFVPVTVGLGKQSATSKVTVGAEIGIAAALADSGRMNAVIKRAVGASYLYPTTNGSVAAEHGTWTPPSYLEKYSIDTSENKIGDIYTSFIDTAREGIEMLIEDGYTPVLRGIWWMQGEAESPYEIYANAYTELLTALISDMREDLSEISGTDCSNLPFVMGKITRNPNYETYDYIDTVNASQVSVTSSVGNTHIVDTSGLAQLDGWHYSADSQHYIGTQFVDKVISSMGKYSVNMSGAGISMSGGGAKSAGESVTLTFKLDDGFVLNSIKMQTGSAEPVAVELNEDGTYTFTMPSENVKFIVEATDPDAIVTEYGTIYSKYTDAETYPFLLFKGGELIYAYEDWHTFVNSNNISDCTLLLRRDYDTSEGGDSYMICRAKGLTIDLGTHTFTRGSKHMFQALSRDTFVNSASIRVKNGTLKTTFNYVNSAGETKSSAPLVVFNSDGGSQSTDNFEFIFDSVTFDVSSGRGIVACYGDGTFGSDSKIILNDCKIYRGSSSSAMTLFSLADSKGNKNDVEVVINGGTLEADTLSKLTFASYSPEREAGLGSPDAISLGKGAGGNEFKLVLPSAYTLPSSVYALSAGNHYPVLEKEENSKKLYTLTNLTTEYGDIKPANADANAYPFVVFKNGEMIGAAAAWHTFINNFSKTESAVPGITEMRSGATLLLRRDYNTGEGGDSWAMCFIDDLVIDLDGHTFTRGAYHMFQAMGRTSSANETKITVKGGTLKTVWSYVNSAGATKSANPLICFNNHAESTVNDSFDFIFDGVTFDLTEGRGIATSFADGTYGTENTITLNDCTIDIGSFGYNITLFTLADTGNKNDTKVFINGGTLKADSLNKVTFATYDSERTAGLGSPDGFAVGKSGSGKEFKIILPSSATLPTAAFAFTDGRYYPVIEKEENSKKHYTLTNLTTGYGDIKPANADANAYPFVVFKNGEMIGAAAAWHTFINNFSKTESAVPGITEMRSGATLLLRRDYNTGEGGDSWAMCFIDDLVIDLGGHTFTRGAYHMFQAMGRTSSANETKITVKGGTLKTTWSYVNSAGATKSAAPLICFNNHAESTVNDKFDFIFEGVTFDLTSGRGIVSAFGDGTFGTVSTVTLNDCTIVRGSLTYAMTVFGLADSSGNKNDVKVTVNGGKLTAESLEGLTFASYSPEREAGLGSPDSFRVGTGADGKPFVIELPSSYITPKSEYMFTEGAHYLAKVANSEQTASYAFTKSNAINSFVPKMSLTLDRSLVLNVYIPLSDKLSAVKLGDEALDLGTLEVKDGYYVKSIPLAAKEAAGEISLICTLESVGTGRFTLSVLKYAEKILSSEASGTEEKTLVRDVLAYVRAAYAYFGTNDDAAMEKIGSLIGEGYFNKPVAEGSSEAQTEGLKSATFVLDGEPSMRFYLADGADASKYAFYIDGTRVKTETFADGKYIDVDVYAYALCETVSYTVDGIASGSFHINAYYTYVSGDTYTEADKEELVKLTECFWRYLQSARDYRSSVIGG